MHVSTCVGCAQADDHPKHIVDTAGHNAVWHHDCHAAAGCHVCQHLLADAPEGVKGEALREHLMSLGPRQWTHHDDGTVTYENVEA